MLDGLAVCMVLEYLQFLLVFAMVEAGTPVPNLVWTISEAPVPMILLGNPADPLLLWLMEPYSGIWFSGKHRKFNFCISRNRHKWSRTYTCCASRKLWVTRWSEPVYVIENNKCIHLHQVIIHIFYKHVESFLSAN